MAKLMVVVSDRISNIIEKGELIDGYYNPNGFFSEVIFLITNDDRPNLEKLKASVAGANVKVYNVPSGKSLFIKSCGYRPLLLKEWSRDAVQIAQTERPDMVRCYGNRLSGYVSYRIKESTGIPYILSMHEAPDNIVKSEKRFARTIQYALLEKMGLLALKNADRVIAVYDSIVDDLKRRKISKYKVIHNAVNGKHLVKKEDYSQKKERLRIVSVGRLIRIKNPENLIKAVAADENLELDVVGNGELREELMSLARDLNCTERIKFIEAIPNDELCEKLQEYDIFAVHDGGIGVSKAVIEAWLAGMPVIINEPVVGVTTEFSNENIVMVENTKEGYAEGIKRLSDAKVREKLGNSAYEYAIKEFSPDVCANQIVELCKEVLEERKNLGL